MRQRPENFGIQMKEAPGAMRDDSSVVGTETLKQFLEKLHVCLVDITMRQQVAECRFRKIQRGPDAVRA